MKKKSFLFMVISLSRFLLHAQDNNGSATANYRIYIESIPTISIHDEQYSIKFWLAFNYKNQKIDFQKQLQILNSGRTEMNIVDSQILKDTSYTVLLKISCIVHQSWDLDFYPFDRQQLSLKIYLASLDANKLVFKNDSINSPVYDYNSNIENGWKVHSDKKLTHVSDLFSTIPSDDRHIHSVISTNIDIHVDNPVFLFLKLFIGMYVAFLVAYMAFYIDVKHVEPRFGLPVGALFAAIGNKYIVESILPQTPNLSIADWLHSFTFLTIILIIAFSSASLKLRLIEKNNQKLSKNTKQIKEADKESEKSNETNVPIKNLKLLQWIDKYGARLIFISYCVVNLIVFVLAIIDARFIDEK
jgi:hypothetical protein